MAGMILAGTRKGLFLLRGDGDRRSWTVEEPVLDGWEIYHAMQDPRDGSLYAAGNHPVYGASVHRSTDSGKTWTRSEGLGLPEEGELKLEKTWHVEPGRDSETGRLWLGAAPGVLFRSDDSGESWEVNEALLNHPTRERWNPGAGGMCTHSIQLDPAEPNCMYIGISAAGVFRSEDGGETGDPANKGTAADFMPDDPFPGGRPVRPQAPAARGTGRPPLAAEPLRRLSHRRPRRELGAARGERPPERVRLPARARPPTARCAFVIPEDKVHSPEVGGGNRITTDGRLRVYRTEDGGKTWDVALERAARTRLGRSAARGDGRR